ncbi:MAG: hypothetical protein ACRCRZ_00710 [Metamycoplasmataceae bacterium]
MLKKNNYFKLSIFDIALMAILFGVFVIVKLIAQVVLVGPLNIAIEFIFFILSGIIFGPFKGILFSILADTFIQLLTGGIAFWLWQYAIVPPLVSLFSWLFYFYYNKSSIKMKMILPPIIIGLIILTYTIVISILLNIPSDISKQKISPLVAISCSASLFFILIITYFICWFLYKKRNNIYFLEIINQIAIISFIMVVFRWLWGTYAFIVYANRFFANGSYGPDSYIYVFLGISFKSIIVVPIFSMILVPTNKILLKIQKRYYNNSY